MRYFNLNDNKNMTYQNLWGATKAILRNIFIAINT